MKGKNWSKFFFIIIGWSIGLNLIYARASVGLTKNCTMTSILQKKKKIKKNSRMKRYVLMGTLTSKNWGSEYLYVTLQKPRHPLWSGVIIDLYFYYRIMISDDFLYTLLVVLMWTMFGLNKRLGQTYDGRLISRNGDVNCLPIKKRFLWGAVIPYSDRHFY